MSMEHGGGRRLLQMARRFFVCEGRALWPTLFLAAQMLYGVQPWRGNTIGTFDRVLGAATVAGIRVAGRTGGALAMLLVRLPLALLVSWAAVSLAIGGKSARRCADISPALSAFSGMGVALLALRYAQRFGGERDNYLTDPQGIALIFVVCLLLWGLFCRCVPAKRAVQNADTVLQALLCALLLSFPLQMVLRTGLDTAILFALMALAALAVCMVCTLAFGGGEGGALAAAGLPVLACLPVALLYMELGNILNQYEVFIGSYRTGVTVLTALALAAGAACGVWQCLAQRKGRRQPLRPGARREWRRVWYPLIVAAFGLLGGQPELQTLVGTDFFERANSAVSVSGFLRFGQLPVIQTHGAHMLSDSLGGILFGLVNRDALAGSLLKYDGLLLALTALLFYYLLCRCISPDAAFAAALLLPVTNTGPGDWYAHLSYLPVLAALAALRRPGAKSYALFWLAAAFSVLYRGDTGLAVGGAAVLVLAAAALCRPRRRRAGAFALTGLAVGGAFGALFIVLCLACGVQPFARLWEFLQVMALSNQDWAYASIGIEGTAGMAFTYLITPVALLAMAAWLLHAAPRPLTDAHWMFFIFTGGYLINFPRTLVRHSLAEAVPVYCLACGMWALALGVWLLWRQRDTARRSGGVALPMALLCAVLLSGALFDSRLVDAHTLTDAAFGRFDDGAIVQPMLITPQGEVTRQDSVNSRVPRAVLPAQTTALYDDLQAELEQMLAPDETWLDFTNQSALYALIGRPSPVYVNQSPGLVSGEFSQRAFIQQIEQQRERVPLALLPQQPANIGFELDGVLNTLRYYRIAEYIYNNFVPYKTVDGYAIWVRPERMADLGSGAAGEGGAELLTGDLSGLSPQAASLSTKNGTLTLQAVGEDPQMYGLERLLNAAGVGKGSVTLAIRYTSTTSGDMQIFYAEPGRNYSEENSVRVPVNATQEERLATVTFPWTPTTRLRFDTPDDSAFVIYGISQTQSSAAACGYDYASYDYAHVYHMGDIALLWGEHDAAHAADNAVLCEEPERTHDGYWLLPEAVQGGENGRYVRMVYTCDNEEGGGATLTLLRYTGNGAGRLAAFDFTLAPGTHTYLVRVSADCYWYAGTANALGLITAGPNIRLESLSLLEGD